MKQIGYSELREREAREREIEHMFTVAYVVACIVFIAIGFYIIWA